jgi:hypothetical protein
MSFINNAHPGSQINLLCLIYRLISENSKKFTVEEIQKYCAAESLFSSEDHKKRFRENLNYWLDSPHKLWKTDENGKLELDLPCDFTGNKPSDIAYQLRHRLMQLELDDILSEDDQHGASKAIRSFAYILTQDNYAIFNKELTPQNLDKSFAKNFGRFSLNNSEKSYFIEFCNFLGISEISGKNEYLDPTRLVESFLSDVFKNENEIPAIDFLKKLSKLIPIIDNGKYNLIVREAIGAEVDMPNSLSINLSHALHRISEKQIINFTKKSDDVNALTLNLPNGNQEHISMVTFQGSK